MKTISIRVSEEQHKLIQETASKGFRNIQKWMEMIIFEALTEQINSPKTAVLAVSPPQSPPPLANIKKGWRLNTSGVSQGDCKFCGKFMGMGEEKMVSNGEMSHVGCWEKDNG